MSLIDEIHEQPESLARLVGTHHEVVRRLAHEMHGSPPRQVLIAARGSSDNAARYAQYLWGVVNRLPVALATPSLYGRYGRPPALDGALVVGISQSGQSPDIVEVIAEGRRQKCPTLAITNDPSSPLADAAGYLFDLQVGAERAVAATKSYTAELLAIALVSAALASDETMMATLREVPERVRAVLARSPSIELQADHFSDLEQCAVVGRGFHLATAYEWALKLQELCGVAALPFSLADFQHGPIALAGPGFPILAAVSPGQFADDTHAMLQRLAAERAVEGLVMGGESGTPRIRTIELPASAEWIGPLVAVVGAQLFCAHLSVAKGLNPEEPRGLRKVTRTT